MFSGQTWSSLDGGSPLKNAVSSRGRRGDDDQDDRGDGADLVFARRGTTSTPPPPCANVANGFGCCQGDLTATADDAVAAADDDATVAAPVSDMGCSCPCPCVMIQYNENEQKEEPKSIFFQETLTACS